MFACLLDFVGLCEPYQLPAPWHTCQADVNARRGPTDSVAALATLLRKYPAEQLVASGIARNGVDGKLELYSDLVGPSAGFVLLRDPQTGKISNVMTARGCLLGDRPPLCQILADQHSVAALQGAEPTIYGTDSIDDALLLRSFGLAAAPVVGLERLVQATIELLCRHFGVVQRPGELETLQMYEAAQAALASALMAGVPDPGTNSDSEGLGLNSMPPSAPWAGYFPPQPENFVKLTLVRWTINQVSQIDPPSMQRLVAEWALLQNHRRISFGEISQWTPNDEELDALNFALERGEPEWIKNALLESAALGNGNLELPRPSSAAIELPATLADARCRWHETLLETESEWSRARQDEARKHYLRLVDQQVTRPLVRAADEAAGPLERALWLQFAQLNSMFLERAPRVQEAAMRSVTHRQLETPKADANELRELLAASGRLLAVVKELSWIVQKPPAKGRLMLTVSEPTRR